MKARSHLRFSASPMAGACLLVLCHGGAFAATPLYWNPEGPGEIWGTSPGEKNWNTVPAAPTGNIAWPDTIDDVAVFQDLTGGVVTLSEPLQAAGIIQNGANYSIAAGIITLVPDSAVTNPFINVQGGALAIDSVLAGSNGLIKNGVGTLSLTGSNTFSGTTRIENGTLSLAGSLASTSLSISSGATFLNQNGGLSNSTTLTNAGSLTLSSDDTITTYISDGGTLTAATSTLFTTSAILNNGSTVAGLLNTGTLTSNGAVSISGTATVTNTATVQSGTLNLTGSLVTPILNISSGATMIQNGTIRPVSLSSRVVVTNEGSFIIRKSAIVDTYTSNGGLLDIQGGRMGTRNVFLNDGSMTMGGPFSADLLVTSGNVTIAGSALGDVARIASGSLLLQGNLSSRNVEILSGASLLNQNGGLSNTANLSNAGSLTLNADDTVAIYTSNGGTLTAGPGSLFTTSATLNDGSTIAGSLTANTLTANGTVTSGGTVNVTNTATVQSGIFHLTGELNTPALNIAPGATMIQSGRIGPASVALATAVVTNQGDFFIRNNTFIKTYLSNGGTLDVETGQLHTQSVILNEGSTTRGGNFRADQMVTNGAVRIEGGSVGANARIASGVLTLTGTLGFTNVLIDAGATLYNQGGSFSHTVFLTNAGSLKLDASGIVMTYLSNGGTITNGAGTLSANTANLNDGSSIDGLLDTNTLTSNGIVRVGGTVSAGSINIASGTLTNTGTLGKPSTLLNIDEGATLAAGGIQQYSLLTTSGAGPGTWLGDLDNTSMVAPGGVGAIGTLAVDGNFTQSPSGMLKFDLSATDSDLLDVSGSATFKGALDLNQLGVTPIAPFVPVTVVSASSYAGNITSFSENLEGAVLFNPGNGTVIRFELPSGSGGAFSGSTRNQTSTWSSLYDDVIDPGIANITSGPGGYEITSGIMDIGNPDLLWALWASFTPAGLDAALLNRLSPEVYGGFSDYAMQATRAHQRSALTAPALEPRDGSTGGMGSSAKSGAKAGIADITAPTEWEFFAAVDYFRAGTENSLNQADYDFDGMGVLGGARTRLRDHTQFAVYLGADSGSIDGELIDADALGWTFGVIGEHLIHEKSRTRLTAGISYGSYLFDGTRGSASATGTGWTPGNVDFDEVDVEAFDLFIGIDGVAWQQDALTLVPSAGLRYAMSKMDSFSESTGGAPGSPIALEVGRDRHESLLLELGLLAQVEVSPKIALWGEGGLNFGLLDDGRTLSASFANGSRAMRAEADGLEDDSLYLGCGAVYQITENIRAAIGYRADLRSGAEAQQELRLSSSWRF